MANTHTTTASMTVKIVVNDKGNPPGKLAELSARTIRILGRELSAQ